MKHSFKVEESGRVLELLPERTSGMSLSLLKRLLKQREIKVNGKRTSENVTVKKGDIVEIFIPKAFDRSEVEIVYEDDNILVANKPPFSSVESGLTQTIKTQKHIEFLAPVHRLDTNTRGLVILAKAKAAEEVLLAAFKARTIEKQYRALVMGVPKEGIHKAYLFKDEKTSTCYVSDEQKQGFKEILTKCKVIKAYQAKSNVADFESISEVELTLLTGRTHQLRAHLKHLGSPIIGDDKYGDYEMNKQAGTSIQQLIAFKLHFNEMPAPLENLADKTIEIPPLFDPRVVERLTQK